MIKAAAAAVAAAATTIEYIEIKRIRKKEEKRTEL